MAQLNVIEVEAEVTHQYLTDPEFHARVRIAVQLTAASLRRATGMSMGQEFEAAVVQACAYGVYAADLDMTNNVDDEIAERMRADAERLGFQLAAKQASEDA